MLAWIASSWHKLVIVLIALDRLWERLKPVEQFIERRIGERRHNAMNIPVLSELANFIEGIFKHTAPGVVTAVEQAAAGAAVQSAEEDPKVQAVTAASIALLSAAQSLKAAINKPAAAPEDQAKPAA